MRRPGADEWRPMRQADVPAVMRLSEAVHPTFFEGAATFHDRLALYPAGMLVLPGEGTQVAGYAMGYPAPLGSPPPLDTVLGRLSSDADALYLHDVAVAPALRGSGLAAPAIRRLLALAGARPVMLVSVYGTAPFWRRFGFREMRDGCLGSKLASYGADAVFMLRSPHEKTLQD